MKNWVLPKSENVTKTRFLQISNCPGTGFFSLWKLGLFVRYYPYPGSDEMRRTLNKTKFILFFIRFCLV